MWSAIVRAGSVAAKGAASAAAVTPQHLVMRTVCGSSVCMAGQASRISRGQARSGNEYGPLTDMADWEYMDADSPDEAKAPLTKAQLRRARIQQRTLDRIVELTADIDNRKTVAK